MKKHKFKIINNDSGFTLVEILIYISIFSLMVTGLASLTLLINQSMSVAQNRIEVDSQYVGAIKIMSQTIRDSKGINSPSVGAQSDSLSLKTIDSSKNPTVFFVDEGVLYISEGLGSPTPLTNNRVLVADLGFYNLSRPNTHGLIQIDMTVNQFDSIRTMNFNSVSAVRNNDDN